MNPTTTRVDELVRKQNHISAALRTAKKKASRSADPELAAFQSLSVTIPGMPVGWRSIRAAAIADDVMRASAAARK